jgi:hypothetical protein
MTKEEALRHMFNGKKVTHRWFSDYEWMTIEDGKIATEEGYKHNPQQFWSYRNDESWNDEYSLFEE